MSIPSWAWEGRRCVWLHTPRGGYGFTLRIPVRILNCGKTRARVHVEQAGKSTWVPYTSLLDANMRNEDGRRCEPPGTRADEAADGGAR